MKTQGVTMEMNVSSRVLRDSTPSFVGLSVRPSVRPSNFTFSALMGFLALLLLPKCSADLNYGPCPPARDWGSRVSGLFLLDQINSNCM